MREYLSNVASVNDSVSNQPVCQPEAECDDLRSGNLPAALFAGGVTSYCNTYEEVKYI